MEFTITVLATGVATTLRIPDEKCDALLDKLSARMPPNPEMDARWERMMAKREAAAREAAKPETTPRTRTKRRR